MPEIYNPGRGKQVSDYRTHKDGAGNPIEYARTSRPVTLNGTVALGDALMWVIATATQEVRVTKLGLIGTATIAHQFAGVALEAGNAGDDIMMSVGGPTLVNTDADPSSFVLGDVAVAPTTTTGTVGRVAKGTWANTDIAGTAVGHFIGPGNASPAQALVDIHRF